MMFKEALVLMGLSLALSANAGPSYYGYALDEATDIVTGGGLEWLQWDRTIGQSVNTALDEHGDDDWRIATDAEISALLNDFFETDKFDGNAATYNRASFDNAAAAPGPGAKIHELFGKTTDGFATWALYGGLALGTFRSFTEVAVWDWSNYVTTADRAVTFSWVYDADTALDNVGVALVREGNSHTSVPAPPTALLLMTALLGLFGTKRLARRSAG